MNAVNCLFVMAVVSLSANTGGEKGKVCPSNVHVMSPVPRSCTVDGLPSQKFQEIEKKVQTLSRKDDAEDALEKTEILAWSMKADTCAIPPEYLAEEVLVLTRWKDRSWLLFFLEKSLDDPDESRRAWKEGTVDLTGKMLWKQQFSKRPSEKQIIHFVRQTNFGNNEFNDCTLTLGVILYAIDDFKQLKDELAKGLPEKVKRHRREHYGVTRVLKAMPTPFLPQSDYTP